MAKREDKKVQYMAIPIVSLEEMEIKDINIG